MSPGRGITRWIPSAWLVLLLLFVLALPRAARADAPIPRESARATADDYRISEKGRRFRVRFDPASNISVGVAGAFTRGPGKGAPRPAFELAAGIAYRNLWIYGADKEKVIWQIDHRIITGAVQPVRASVAGVPALDAAVYSVSLLRHDESPVIVLPSSPPASIPFPFDIGFESELGRVVVPSYLPPAQKDGAPTPMLHLGVLRVALLLDPWRTGKAGKGLEIGVGARYDIDAYAEPTFKTPKMVHRVAPMTAASLRFRLQSYDGLTVFDLRADSIPHWTSESVWKFMALSSLRLSRTLIAINDQPIGVYLEGNYRFAPITKQVEATHDVRVSAGVSFNLALK
jgi:hypothetical protein